MRNDDDAEVFPVSSSQQVIILKSAVPTHFFERHCSDRHTGGYQVYIKISYNKSRKCNKAVGQGSVESIS